MPNYTDIILALAGGVIPALVWLWFWLREDRLHPEPRLMLLLAFLTGMLAVPLVIPFEKAAYDFAGANSLLLFFLWAAIEEITKFGLAYLTVLKNRAVDEPMDTVIYMITVALGFSAVENALFLLTPFTNGNFLGGLVTGDLRAMGATLLHVTSSATIGLFMAFSFYRDGRLKKQFLLWGVILAILLHTLFNLFIIAGGSGGNTLSVFFSVWIAVLVLIIILEKVKTITRSS